MSALPRMRTAEGVMAEIKAQDPETGISLYFIRGLIRSGDIPVVSAGRRKLVNVDTVMDYLATQATSKPISYKSQTYGKVVSL